MFWNQQVPAESVWGVWQTLEGDSERGKEADKNWKLQGLNAGQR